MRVMVFGTFDIFHPGHKNFFKQAREYGDELYVVVAHDENVKKNKGKYPINSQKERIKAISESGLADKVLPGRLEDVFQVIKENEPD